LSKGEERHDGRFLGLGSTLKMSRLLSQADSQAINIVDPAFYAPIDSKLQNPPSSGKHLAFDHHLCPGSGEFDAKGIPEGRKFDLFQGGVGNLN